MADIIQIRMQLTGARETAAEAAIASDAIAGTGTAATVASRRASSSASRWGRTRSVLSSVGRVAKYAGAGLAGVGIAAVYELKRATQTTEELGLATAGLNRNLFDNITASSEWAAVARARDIDTRSLNMSFTTLSRNLVDLKKGSTTAKSSFGLLGLTQKDLAAANGDFNESLLIVADAFGKAKAGAKRQAAAQKLLGRGYQTILPLFAEGRDSLEQQTSWAKRFGNTMGIRTKDDLARFRREQIKAKLAMQGFEVLIGTKVVPVLTKLIDKVLKFVVEIRKGKGAGGEFADSMEGVYNTLKSVFTVVKDVTRVVKGLVDALNSLDNISLPGQDSPLGLPGGLFSGGVKGNAHGTSNWRGGLTMVGEEGPELVGIPRHGQVLSKNATRNALKNAFAPPLGGLSLAGAGATGTVVRQPIVLAIDGREVASTVVTVGGNHKARE